MVLQTLNEVFLNQNRMNDTFVTVKMVSVKFPCTLTVSFIWRSLHFFGKKNSHDAILPRVYIHLLSRDRERHL
jgi:hypothetical protein